MIRSKDAQGERGVALILALLMVLLLSTLAAALVFVTNTETWSNLNYRLTEQARYVAEAGAEYTINWINVSGDIPSSDISALTASTYPVTCPSTVTGCKGGVAILGGSSANWPTANSTGSNFTSQVNTSPYNVISLPGVTAYFTTYATLLASGSAGSGVAWMGGGSATWQITSVGTVSAGVRTATVQVVETYVTATAPIFTAGVVTTASGCVGADSTAKGTALAPVYFNGPCETYASSTNGAGPCTDSYNSANGPYKLGSGGVVGASGGNSSTSGGNVTANGFIDVGSSSTGDPIIDGNIYSSLSTAAGSPGTSCTGGYALDGGNMTGSATSTSTVKAPCPWGCSACGTTACYPPGVTPNTGNYTISGTSCSSTPGCTYLGVSPGIYDCSGSTCTSGNETTPHEYYLAPGTYGNLTLGSTASSDKADIYFLQAGGTYNINSLYFTQDQQFVVQGNGPVTINITGESLPSSPSSGLVNESTGAAIPSAIYVAGQAGFNLCDNSAPGNVGILQSGNCDTGTCTGSGATTSCTASAGPGTSSANPISGYPGNMQIVYAGTGVMRVGGSPNSLVIYMPQAPFYQPGAAVGLNGSIVSSQFIDDSNSPFNYDSALNTTVMQPFGFMCVGFSWSKY